MMFFTRFIFLTALIFLSSHVYATSSTDEVVRSAEEIVTYWDRVVSKEYTIVDGNDGVWGVYRSKSLSPLKYDIRKTDSLVSPYMLIMSFKAKWDNNYDSINANLKSEVFDNNFGFTSKEDAIKNTTEKDYMGSKPRKYDCVIYYSYQKNRWVFNRSNSDFKGYINENSSVEMKNAIFPQIAIMK